MLISIYALALAVSYVFSCADKEWKGKMHDFLNLKFLCSLSQSLVLGFSLKTAVKQNTIVLYFSKSVLDLLLK